jgi:hypothetical protein
MVAGCWWPVAGGPGVFARAGHEARIAWMAYRGCSAEGTGFVVGLLIVAFVIVALALYGLDRAIKARAQVRRLRSMTDRLDAATVRAEKQQEKREAAEQASAALTSVISAIKRPPLTLPGTPSHDAAVRASETAEPAAAEPAAAEPAVAEAAGAEPAAAEPTAASPAAAQHGAARPKGGREHTGPHARRSTHPGRRLSHVTKHVGTLRPGQDGADHDEGHTRVIPAAADAE